ncbi:MAG: hypothetical protein WAV27_14955 [Xanthobacteraceae bacterium]
MIVKIILGLDAVECDQERTKNRNANIAADLGVPIRLAGASVQPNARHIVPDASAKESGKFGFDNRQEFCRRYFLPFGHALAKPKQAAIVPAICALIVLVRVLPACRGRLTKLKREPWPHFGAFSCRAMRLVSVREQVESNESFVIQEWWPDSRMVTDVDGEKPQTLRPQRATISKRSDRRRMGACRAVYSTGQAWW